MPKAACWVGCNLTYKGTLSIVTFQPSRAKALAEMKKRKPHGRYFFMNLMDGDAEEHGVRLKNFLIGNRVPEEEAPRMVREFAKICAECFI